METAKERFVPVSLSFNIGALGKISDIGNVMDCNSGGSVICNPGTGGCGQGGMTCVTTSCSGKSATLEAMFDAHILVERAMLEKLQTRLRQVVSEFSK